MRARRLRDEERPAQVGVEDEVPVVPGHVGGALAHVAAGVVHEDVDAAERVVRDVGHRADAGLIANVQLERARTRRPSDYDLLLERAQRRRPIGWSSRSRRRPAPAHGRTTDPARGSRPSRLRCGRSNRRRVHGRRAGMVMASAPPSSVARRRGAAARTRLALRRGARCGDEWRDVDCAARHQVDAGRVFSARRAGAQQRELAADHLLERSSTDGARLPTSVTVPPLRTERTPRAPSREADHLECVIGASPVGDPLNHARDV